MASNSQKDATRCKQMLVESSEDRSLNFKKRIRLVAYGAAIICVIAASLGLGLGLGLRSHIGSNIFSGASLIYVKSDGSAPLLSSAQGRRLLQSSDLYPVVIQTYGVDSYLTWNGQQIYARNVTSLAHSFIAIIGKDTRSSFLVNTVAGTVTSLSDYSGPEIIWGSPHSVVDDWGNIYVAPDLVSVSEVTSSTPLNVSLPRGRVFMFNISSKAFIQISDDDYLVTSVDYATLTNGDISSSQEQSYCNTVVLRSVTLKKITVFVQGILRSSAAQISLLPGSGRLEPWFANATALFGFSRKLTCDGWSNGGYYINRDRLHEAAAFSSVELYRRYSLFPGYGTFFLGGRGNTIYYRSILWKKSPSETSQARPSFSTYQDCTGTSCTYRVSSSVYYYAVFRCSEKTSFRETLGGYVEEWRVQCSVVPELLQPWSRAPNYPQQVGNCNSNPMIISSSGQVVSYPEKKLNKAFIHDFASVTCGFKLPSDAAVAYSSKPLFSRIGFRTMMLDYSSDASPSFIELGDAYSTVVDNVIASPTHGTSTSLWDFSTGFNSLSAVYSPNLTFSYIAVSPVVAAFHPNEAQYKQIIKITYQANMTTAASVWFDLESNALTSSYIWRKIFVGIDGISLFLVGLNATSNAHVYCRIDGFAVATVQGSWFSGVPIAIVVLNT